ncbi:MAG TPA: DUF72 domain-containing protein [Candidatus Binatia bacterium]|jgi:uncharacterized protein YecE (DUF72 family)|nr:DUF72 domain-containing protein [Candidatus Binatia bacterium]
MGRAAAPRVLVGTSGFSYPAWRGTFYPDDLPARDMLAHYARELATVEINHTFHRLPTHALLTTWSRQTPPRFRFALKAPQRITHQLRLRDAREMTQTFCDLAAKLGPKLGPLLFQLPPYLRFDAARLADFLAVLPPKLEAAFEFRSDGWFNDETYALLAKHRAALCIADAETLSTPPVATAPFGYLRLRRADYGSADLDAWAGRVREMTRWKRAYVYFKHEETGRGPALAREFLSRLG